MTVEIIMAIAGTLGISEILHLIVAKIFSKKQDHITTQKDEFAAIRERLDYNERETNRLNREQIMANRKISRLCNYLVDVITKTCAKKNCALREIINIDFDDLNDLDDDKIDPVENTTEPTINDNERE